MKKNIYDTIIIGAGISGLVTAQRLKSIGHQVLILEKSKGLGGRIATRRDGECAYDHGAQFYKLKPGQTHQLDEYWTGNNVSHTWFERDGIKYKCSANGLTSLVKSIAEKSEIVFSEKVIQIKENLSPAKEEKHIELICDSGQIYLARHCFITSPLPQTREILKTSQINYPADLNTIDYAPALVGLFEVESEASSIVNLSYKQDVGPDIFSISNQLSKKVSSKLAFTVVMQPIWSQNNFDKPEADTLIEVAKLFSNYLNKLDTTFIIKKQQLKKWRYSHPLSTYSKKNIILGEKKNILLIGDAFAGGSIMGAIDSADSVDLEILK